MERLRKISDDFIAGTEIPSEAVQDVVVTGSLAGYEWGNQSDLDVHVVVDPFYLPASPEIIQDYFHEVAASWNARHHVVISGHEVELFIESQQPQEAVLAVVT